jgi:hypothetical protein
MSGFGRSIDVDEALALLPDGARIHTFLGRIGAMWDRDAVEEAIRHHRFGRILADEGIVWHGHRLVLTGYATTGSALWIDIRGSGW